MTAIRAAFKAYRMHQVLIMPRFISGRHLFER